MILVSKGKVVTLIRPKKHSIHPAGSHLFFFLTQRPTVPNLDIHILLNTIHAPSIVSSPAATSWIPICLPKFNSKGFVNAYIEFLGRRKEGSNLPNTSTTSKPDGIHIAQEDASIALVCVSGGGDFESIRSWCTTVAEVISPQPIR